MVRGGVASAVAVFALVSAPVSAQTVQNYDISEQDLAGALKAFAATSGREVLAPSDLIAGKRSGSARGMLSAEQAMRQLLEGTGLRLEIVDGAFVVRPAIDPGRAASDAGSEIVVTGTRIHGAPVASTVITVTAEAARNSGQSSLGEVVRSVPQSFGGGQNPGIGNNVPASRGIDIGGGSSLNLRGLGSDATLTLLNGHRLAYTASLQSVDVSVIPFEAVDRIEIVPDGASALYGSDAVAGVANIILKRDYDGVEASARLGASTAGGDFQQQYGLLAGSTWRSGGFVAAYEYGSNSAIKAEDRTYSAKVAPGLDLFPALRHHSVSLSGHQALTDTLSFEFDGLYNIRWSDLSFPVPPDGRATFSSKDSSFALAPSLRLALPGGWRAALAGTYGQEKVDYSQVECHASCASSGSGYYRNTERSVEINADGPLFALPGGEAKLALGAGYRSIGFDRFNGAGSTVNAQHVQDSYYAYGEINLPLIGPAQGLSFVHQLNASAAARYERYPGIGGVATPKLGIIYAPTADFDLKGSWGRSFRAPTLYQQYQPRGVYLFPAAFVGGANLPPGSPVLLILGGNTALKPERATTWSATFALHPRALSGARLEISYFNVQYRDRIVTPIGFLSEALSDPIYRDQISLLPAEALQAQIIAEAATFLNLTGAPYNPASVAAVVDDANVNAGRQSAHGLDILAGYTAKLAGGREVSFLADVSRLDSTQQLSASQPVFRLAGLLFNPPHWRARASLGWGGGPLGVSATINYIGRVIDNRSTPAVRVKSMAPIDLTLRYRVPKGGGPLGGFDLTLSVQNLFNDKPGQIATTLPSDAPYDSTNYSPVGRFVALGVTKRW